MALELGSTNILFVFLEVSQPSRHRRLFEHTFGFPLIENRFHPPHHRHGIVKYDIGDTVLALNADQSHRSLVRAAHGLTQVFEWNGATELAESAAAENSDLHLSNDGRFYDWDQHSYRFRIPTGSACEAPRLVELELSVVGCLEHSIEFFTHQLGIRIHSVSTNVATFKTENLHLTLRPGDAGTDAIRRDGSLIVFHCVNASNTYKSLKRRGVVFRTSIQSSEIGVSAQFTDPSGNRFCLYEPSFEALTWESGDTVRRIIGMDTPSAIQGPQ